MRLLTLLVTVLALVACTVHVDGAPPPGAMLSCGDGSACPSGMTCDPGTRLCYTSGGASRANGTTCDQNSDCTSGSCVLGLCCADACVDRGAASCGMTGVCDSDSSSADFGQCARYPVTTVCHEAVCSGGQYTPPQSCAGDGSACPGGSSTACPGGAECQDATSCLGWCTVGTPAGCSGGAWCRLEGGVPTCVSNSQEDGDSCALHGDCVGGHCDHGLCCAAGDCCDGTTANCASSFTECDNAARARALPTYSRVRPPASPRTAVWRPPAPATPRATRSPAATRSARVGSSPRRARARAASASTVRRRPVRTTWLARAPRPAPAAARSAPSRGAWVGPGADWCYRSRPVWRPRSNSEIPALQPATA
jgi:hypothetical protein